jgi:hypothetical protein
MIHAADGGLHQFPLAQVSGEADEHGGGEAKRNSIQQVFFYLAVLRKRSSWDGWTGPRRSAKGDCHGLGWTMLLSSVFSKGPPHSSRVFGLFRAGVGLQFRPYPRGPAT